LIDAIEESERCRYRQPRAFVNLLNRINVICLVHPLSQKYFRFRLTQISSETRPSCPNEGRIAIVTDVGMGCGGRGSVGRADERR
jgi:hypothetical protein